MEELLIKTSEKSFNKAVKALLFANCKGIAKYKKLRVPYVGVVRYFYNNFGVTLANVSKNNGQIEIRIKKDFNLNLIIND